LQSLVERKGALLPK